MEPTTSPVLSGGLRGPHKIQGIGAGFVPAVLDTKFIDEVLTISNEAAFDTARALAKSEGIPASISTGANVAAALAVAASRRWPAKPSSPSRASSAERYFPATSFSTSTDRPLPASATSCRAKVRGQEVESSWLARLLERSADPRFAVCASSRGQSERATAAHVQRR